jgi:redox-sensitive bicupin YhaK (pirin superfamily)
MSNPLPLPEAERCESKADLQPEIVSWPARSAELGGGLTVMRALPLRQHRLVGPWCFFDHFGPLQFGKRKAMDVAPHPHIGLQTVSWLFEGEVLHNDSLGCSATAQPGELNLMTAGRGITHSEETPPRNSGRIHGLQLWVALSDTERRREPGFDHYKSLPVLEPGGGRVQVFMGALDSTESGTRAFSPLVGADLKLGANGRLRLPLNPAWEHALVIIEGEVSLEGTRLAPGALHYLGTRRSGLELASKAAAHVVLIGGAPFGESVIIWWNFVARSAEEIREAREDWEQHRHFSDVKAYKGERLKAPSFIARPMASD